MMSRPDIAVGAPAAGIPRRGRPGRPAKADLPKQVDATLRHMRGELAHEITVREVARRVGVSPTTLYAHGLGDAIQKASKDHAGAMRRVAPKRQRREMAEQLEHASRERDTWRERYENLLRQWQIVEYNLRERHGIDPAALYNAAIPEAKRDVSRIGRTNPRLRPSAR